MRTGKDVIKIWLKDREISHCLQDKKVTKGKNELRIYTKIIEKTSRRTGFDTGINTLSKISAFGEALSQRTENEFISRAQGHRWNGNRRRPREKRQRLRRAHENTFNYNCLWTFNCFRFRLRCSESAFDSSPTRELFKTTGKHTSLSHLS